ncbi:hypothetical protein [Entomobacter blattae]|uniref:Uncharacterized protein n=1 Tax=Entomobacter blattae TaxID=2762277 RepID=A0A7H1NQR8_9PROT|nr:hypothetical protein [Entomobacter blattae]QNT78128.1 hypothetical protein JGUZn3_08960 [Entomobacter blattae]
MKRLFIPALFLASIYGLITSIAQAQTPNDAALPQQTTPPTTQALPPTSGQQPLSGQVSPRDEFSRQRYQRTQRETRQDYQQNDRQERNYRQDSRKSHPFDRKQTHTKQQQNHRPWYGSGGSWHSHQR